MQHILLYLVQYSFFLHVLCVILVNPALPQIPQQHARFVGGAAGPSCSDGVVGHLARSSCSSCSGGGTEGYGHTKSSVSSRQTLVFDCTNTTVDKPDG